MKNRRYPRPQAPRRRRLLGALTVGGGVLTARILPDHWIRPVVDSVLLPAHAQTSPDADDDSDGFRFSCRVPDPGTIEVGGFADIVMTISPAPGPDVSIDAMGNCDGTEVFNATQDFDFSTGEVTVSVGPLSPACEPGDMLIVTLIATSLDDISTTCTLDVV